MTKDKLSKRLLAPRRFADVVAVALTLAGGIGLFQPSQIAKTLSLGSLIGAVATFGVSRYTHQAYAEIAYHYASQLEDRHTVELEAIKKQIEVRDQEITKLEQLIGLEEEARSEALTRLATEQRDSLQAETKLKSAIASLEQKISLLESEKAKLLGTNAKARVYVESLFASQSKFLEGFKATALESLLELSEKVSGLSEEISRKHPELSDRMEQISAEAEEKREYFQEELNKVPTDLKSMSLTQAGDSLISIVYAMYDHLSLARSRVIRTRETHKHLSLIEAKAELEKQLEALESEDVVPREQVEKLVREYEARIAEFVEHFQQHTDATLKFADEMEKEITGQDPVFEKLKGYVNQQQSQIAGLEKQLQETKKIRLFEDVSDWTRVANQTIMHLARHEIICDALPMPIEERGHEIVFFITPRTEIGMKLVEGDIDKAIESLKIPLGVKAIKITRTGRNLEIRIPIRDKKVEKEAPEVILERPRDLWSLYTGAEFHMCVFASTQTGKTTLTDELDAMMHIRLNGDVKFSAITLKVDGNRDKEKLERFVKPRFMRNHDEYLEGLCGIHEAIENRNLLLVANPDKRFPREIFQLDEYGEFYRLSSDEQKKAGKQAVISLLQTGAGITSETGKGLSAIIIAQNPYVSSLGLQRPDLANTLIVVVGERNIRMFLDSDSANHGLDSEDLTRLKEELKIFKDKSRIASEKAIKEALERGEDGSLADRKCPEGYYSLILPSKGGLKPIIIYNPKPGEFTNTLTGKKNEVAKATCPDCNGTECKRLGKVGSRYTCLNKDCPRKTFTWKGV